MPVSSPQGRLRNAVVGLVVSYQEHDPDRPWTKRNPATRSAQATVIEGPLLLTSAQMVYRATLIEAEREGRPPRAQVRVVHVDPEINLALLTVDEPGFFDELDPLALPEPDAPALPDAPTTRFRWHRQQFEAAPFRIERVDVRESWFGRQRHAFLGGRPDLRNGGWAEPLAADHRLVGIATAQNDEVYWVIPARTVAAYVRAALRPEGYVPFASLGFSWTFMTDPALTAWLGLPQPRGIMVRRVPWGTTGHGRLQARDVLLSLDGHDIDSRGYVQHPHYGSIAFHEVVVEDHRVGDVVVARVWRDRAELELELELRDGPVRGDLIPVRRGDDPPPYAIVGGLVFVELDGDYLRAWGDDWWRTAPTLLVTTYSRLETHRRSDAGRLIVLSQVLPSTWSLGYQDCRDLIVERIDGRPIHSIEQVAEAFASARGSEVRVEFTPNELRSHIIVDCLEIEATTERILAEYGIPAAIRLPEG